MDPWVGQSLDGPFFCLSSKLCLCISIPFLPPDNSVHWTRAQKPRVPADLWYQPQAPSAEVEMTAYVLLAYLTTELVPTREDLTAAMLIVKWLTKQQNSHGGFSSSLFPLRGPPS